MIDPFSATMIGVGVVAFGSYTRTLILSRSPVVPQGNSPRRGISFGTSVLHAHRSALFQAVNNISIQFRRAKRVVIVDNCAEKEGLIGTQNSHKE